MMTYPWDFGILQTHWPILARGLVVTAQLWLLALACGLALGLLVALCRLAHRQLWRTLTLAYIELFRNTPVLVQLVWFFYALPVLTGWQLSPFSAALLGLTLNTSAYAAEVFRNGIQSIPQGQWEGARALGMRHVRILHRIILPQVLRQMLPALTNRAIELGKTTSLASVITVHELMYQTRLLSAMYYRPMELFTAVAVIYFVLIYPGSLLSARLEKRYARQR